MPYSSSDFVLEDCVFYVGDITSRPASLAQLPTTRLKLNDIILRTASCFDLLPCIHCECRFNLN